MELWQLINYYGRMAPVEILLFCRGHTTPFSEWLDSLRERIYYGRDGALVVVLLCGGAKRTQARDIARAQRYWKEYLDAKTSGKD